MSAPESASSIASPAPGLWQARWQRFSSGSVRAFHGYANWLIGISWRRFIVLSALLMIVMGMVHDSPPFTWRVTQKVDSPPPRVIIVPPRAPRAPAAAQAPEAPVRVETPGKGEGVDISIGKDGIRITPKVKSAAEAASAVVEAAQEASRAAAAAASAASEGIHIQLPPGVASDTVREAVAEAKRQIEDSIRDARRDAEQALRDAEEARRDAEAAIAELSREQAEDRPRTETIRVGPGDFMMQFSVLWVLASAILKYTYKGRMQAEVKAAQATETAEAESLKRQVVEARMAAMQAQVEPHFLFNTLASIDHLIETDPARASVMQKNLIALLRASMPTMREASGAGSSGVRDLGRELAVIRPYLEILKVRMEERLATDIAVPDGLLSAEFPPMMIQTLVENAIKHGLEPKAEGGTLRLVAEIVHGKLQVTVADTGLGFGKAATAGTGVGLANIRERLQLLYGPKASLTVAANQPVGTVVTITVPYKTVEGSHG
jgi:predicted  nucleic acid-binding Zn-ribbon protein